MDKTALSKKHGLIHHKSNNKIFLNPSSRLGQGKIFLLSVKWVSVECQACFKKSYEENLYIDSNLMLDPHLCLPVHMGGKICPNPWGRCVPNSDSGHRSGLMRVFLFKKKLNSWLNIFVLFLEQLRCDLHRWRTLSVGLTAANRPNLG